MRQVLRAMTDVPVTVSADGYLFDCRAIDLSTQGALVRTTEALRAHEARPLYWLHFLLGTSGVRALARPVRSDGPLRAFKFIAISDTDRLTIAEHIDFCQRIWGAPVY